MYAFSLFYVLVIYHGLQRKVCEIGLEILKKYLNGIRSPTTEETSVTCRTEYNSCVLRMKQTETPEAALNR
jgi:hypothetical protein